VAEELWCTLAAMRTLGAWLIALVVWAPERRVQAQSRDLAHEVPIDAAVTVTAAGLVIGSELGKADLVPSSCRWCDRDGTDETLNGVDRGVRSALRWAEPKAAAAVSDVTGFLLAPTAAFGGLAISAARDHAEKQTPLNVLLVMECVALSALLNQAVKFTVARERPYAHARSLGGSGQPPPKPDDNLSFWSGHSSLTFTLAAATGTVVTLRDYSFAPAVWAIGGGLAVATAYLRIAADKHYLTDVLVGAIAGSAMGVLVPLIFHPARDVPAESAPSAAAAPMATQVVTFGGLF
jgi:membrane-associated phospholipid phosphatase